MKHHVHEVGGTGTDIETIKEVADKIHWFMGKKEDTIPALWDIENSGLSASRDKLIVLDNHAAPRSSLRWLRLDVNSWNVGHWNVSNLISINHLDFNHGKKKKFEREKVGKKYENFEQ
ncbi:unnamed protein product [Arabis nemorensis]|uniref:Uncharacterized protein n=1 Tax=Arabis nemorensis TaxID=586526 RepID=A0A565BR20_9BRAS|nr:unnamed protein product [Arabis nemorensis]